MGKSMPALSGTLTSLWMSVPIWASQILRPTGSSKNDQVVWQLSITLKHTPNHWITTFLSFLTQGTDTVRYGYPTMRVLNRCRLDDLPLSNSSLQASLYESLHTSEYKTVLRLFG